MRDPFQRELAAYERKMDRLVKRGLRAELADLVRIRRRFDAFRARAIAVLPDRYAMNRAVIAGVVETVAAELVQLERDLVGIVRNGMVEQAAIAEEMADDYANRFLPFGRQPPVIAAATPQMIDVAADFSADLIGLRAGGLSARILGEVNRVVRLSALGAGAGGFNAAAEISAALGGAKRWSWRAERIYRTETLRIHSILTERSIRGLNEIVRTDKLWRWSGISRSEHSSIDGQTVRAHERFTVPLRDGGTVEMDYPRAPGAPVSATVNCGCYEIPVPAQATALRRAA